MTRWTAAIALSLLLLTVGCGQDNADEQPGYAVAKDGLAIHATADLAVVQPGDTITVSVRIENTSDQTIRWTARNTAPVHVRVQEESELEMGLWQDMKVYPEMAGMAITPHEFAPGEEKTYTMNVPVEPDWPRGEVVRLAVHPTGRRELTGTIKVKVAASDESDSE